MRSLTELKYWYVTRPLHKLWWKFIFVLPKEVVYYADIRLGANATTGKYSNTIVPELTFLDAIERWDGNDRNRR